MDGYKMNSFGKNVMLFSGLIVVLAASALAADEISSSVSKIIDIGVWVVIGVIAIIIIREIVLAFSGSKSSEVTESKSGLFGKKKESPEAQARAADAKDKKKEAGRTAHSDVRTTRRSDRRVAREVDDMVKLLSGLEQELVPKNVNKVNWRKSEGKLDDLKNLGQELGGYCGIISQKADEIGELTSNKKLKTELQVNKNEILKRWRNLEVGINYIRKNYGFLQSSMALWDEFIGQLKFSIEDAKAIGKRADAVLAVEIQIEKEAEK